MATSLRRIRYVALRAHSNPPRGIESVLLVEEAGCGIAACQMLADPFGNHY